MVSHLDLFWNWATRELRNGLLVQQGLTRQHSNKEDYLCFFFCFIILKVEVKPSAEVAAESEEESEESEESEEESDSDDEEEESDSEEESDDEDSKTETVRERIEVWTPWLDKLLISTENPREDEDACCKFACQNPVSRAWPEVNTK